MKEDFQKTFINVPLAERKMPIYVDEEYGPISWLVLALEVEHETELSKKALDFLKRENII